MSMIILGQGSLRGRVLVMRSTRYEDLEVHWAVSLVWIRVLCKLPAHPRTSAAYRPRPRLSSKCWVDLQVGSNSQTEGRGEPANHSEGKGATVVLAVQ